MENTNLLKTSLNEFANASELYDYIKSYLTNSGIVSVADIDIEIKNKVGMEHIFTVDFMNQYEPNGAQKRYYVFICPLEEDLKKLIGKIQTGLNSAIPYRKVAFGYFNYDYTTKNMAKSVGLELLGYSDILEINNAIDSGTKGLPYFNIGNSFVAGLAKNLNAKSKFTGGNNFSSELNNQFSGLSEAINEGFNQLKDSLSGLFNKNTPNSQFSGNTGNSMNTGGQAGTYEQQVEEPKENSIEQSSSEEKQSENDTKSSINLSKDIKEKEDKPISLKKD